MVYIPAHKTFVKIHARYKSDEQNGDVVQNFDNDVVLLPANTPSHAKARNLDISKQEAEFANLLDEIAPGILDTNKSVVLEPIPTDVLDKLFARNVKFSDKISSIKGYLAQPLRTALVDKMPTHDSDVVRHSVRIQNGIELLYILRCIVAVLPQFYGMCKDIIEGLAKTDPKLITDSEIDEISKLLTKMRGVSAAASAVASAALKIFYTVDGMAFDEFSMSLSALEWEQITLNMNSIRLEYSKEIRDISTPEYHFTTSKQKKISDKKTLDENIEKSRIPLVRIQKITLEDLHRDTQTKIQSLLKIKSSDKKVRYDRKALLAKVRTVILHAYRKDEFLDILKYALENPIDF
jgi:hypothetical protein